MDLYFAIQSGEPAHDIISRNGDHQPQGGYSVVVFPLPYLIDCQLTGIKHNCKFYCRYPQTFPLSFSNQLTLLTAGVVKSLGKTSSIAQLCFKSEVQGGKGCQEKAENKNLTGTE